MSESRLSRELGAPVFGLNLGARNRKPGRLEPLAFPTAPSTVPSLTMILGKEDGEAYYAANKPLFESPTAVKILVAKNQQEAYSRMVLLRAPSRCVAVPRGTTATASSDLYNEATAVTDAWPIRSERALCPKDWPSARKAG